jgi:hypothetical protein
MLVTASAESARAHAETARGLSGGTGRAARIRFGGTEFRSTDAMTGQLTVRDEAPQAVRSTPRGSQVRELLAVYQQVLDTVGELPPAPMVLRKHGGRLHYLPRPKWLLRYFVVRHVGHTLACLSRRYSARAALGQAAEGERHDREAVREFQQSLPPDRQKIYLVLLTVAIVVSFRPIINAVVPVAINATKAGGGGSELRQKVLVTVEKVGAALTANVPSLNEALNAVLNGGLLHLAVVTLGVTLSAYVVLRPLVPAFRLKRMMFNLAPEPQGPHRSAVARWSVSQAMGLYECERRVLAELGAHPPREFPLDLAVSTLAVAFPLAFSALLFRADAVISNEGVVYIAWAACVLIAVLVRLGWLWRSWQRRQLGRSGPYPPYEVRIRGGMVAAKVENPIGVRLLVVIVVFVFVAGSFTPAAPGSPPVSLSAHLVFSSIAALVAAVLVSLPWWYRINRELRDLDRAYDSPKARGRPLRAVLMMTVGWLVVILPLIAVFRIGRHIQRAQARAGRPVTVWSPWILAPGLVLVPVLFAYLQHELNKVWAVEGEPLDPWRADSAGTLPWLKAKRPRSALGRRG